MEIKVSASAFDPWQILAEYQTSRGPAASRRSGATAVFVGTMREINEEATVSALTLEHYPGMTERELERTVAAAVGEWSLDDALVWHRVGTVEPGDPIVLVAVWSTHRKAAFEACRHIMEVLKTRAPFWKQEQRAQGRRWVEHNTPG